MGSAAASRSGGGPAPSADSSRKSACKPLGRLSRVQDAILVVVPNGSSHRGNARPQIRATLAARHPPTGDLDIQSLHGLVMPSSHPRVRRVDW
jgi:hypothetical protein